MTLAGVLLILAGGLMILAGVLLIFAGGLMTLAGGLLIFGGLYACMCYKPHRFHKVWLVT